MSRFTDADLPSLLTDDIPDEALEGSTDLQDKIATILEAVGIQEDDRDAISDLIARAEYRAFMLSTEG